MPNVRPITDLKNYDSLLENVSAGSIAEILTPDGLVVMMKASSGDWIEL